jgi:hypothetical protein
MGAASMAVLFYTHGSVSALVVMYSINVFLTFSLSQFGMAKFFFQNRHVDESWVKYIVIHLIGLTLCVTILIVTVYEKFGEVSVNLRKSCRHFPPGMFPMRNLWIRMNGQPLFWSAVITGLAFTPGFPYFGNFPSSIAILSLWPWRRLIPAHLREYRRLRR